MSRAGNGWWKSLPGSSGPARPAAVDGEYRARQNATPLSDPQKSHRAHDRERRRQRAPDGPRPTGIVLRQIETLGAYAATDPRNLVQTYIQSSDAARRPAAQRALLAGVRRKHPEMVAVASIQT